MVAYKLKVMNDEEDKLHFSPIRQNINDYPREENNCGDDSDIFIPYFRHVCDTVIADSIDLSSNKISESIDSVLSSLHVSGVKYSIYSSKKETPTNIIIHK